MKQIFTCIPQKDWQLWGESWLCSAIYLAKFDPQNIFILNNDFNEKTLSKILSKNINVVNFQDNKNNSLDILLHLINYVKTYNFHVAFFENSTYFQDSLDFIFEKNLSLTKDFKFFSFNHEGVQIVENILKIALIFGEIKEFDKFFLNYFSNFFDFLDNDLISSTTKSPIVQVPDSKDFFLAGRNFLFWEKYKKLYTDFTGKRKNVPCILNTPILRKISCKV